MSRRTLTYLVMGATVLLLATGQPSRAGEKAPAQRVGPWRFVPGKEAAIRCTLERPGGRLQDVGTLRLPRLAGMQKNDARTPAIVPLENGVRFRTVFGTPQALIDLKIYPLEVPVPAVRMEITVVNTGKAPLKFDSLTVSSFEFSCRDYRAASLSDVWSFQGSSTPERADWILPLREGFYQRNYQGMNAPDYGGGIPLVDCWTRHGGVAVASLSRVPLNCSLPVRAGRGLVSLGLVLHEPVYIAPGDSTLLPQICLMAHEGDYFNALRTYALVMDLPGGKAHTYPEPAYDVEWCGWGYERIFKPEQILQTLPTARRLGAGWATVDDGWQNADGDWDPDVTKFPEGERGVRKLVDSIHASGLRARLWWVPLEAHDSAYSVKHEPARMKEFGMGMQSRLALVNPSWFQLNRDGSRTQVSWWNSYTLCSAVPEVRAYYCRLVTRMIRDWGFDGLKIDGQNLNAIPPCYNPAHHHVSPWDAPAALPEFFRQLNATVHALKPDAVLSLCPCGTTFSLYHLPYVQQPVGSDPKNAWQVRLRAKTYKALLGGDVPYNGDHVELTNRVWDESTQSSKIRGEEDFASTIGTGGVVATKFTLPGIAQPDSSLALTPTKEARWKHWLSIYQEEKPSKGEYLNLYDIAFDRPETHVIQKGDTLYYAFFAPGRYRGIVQLRGLEAGSYDVINYVTGQSMGSVTPGSSFLRVDFSGALLVKALPQTKVHE